MIYFFGNKYWVTTRNNPSTFKVVVVIKATKTVSAEQAHKKLPWVHTNIGNSKRVLDGFHHSIGKGYLQNYLNEFCYKLNRRNFESDMFDRIITAGVDDVWYKNKAQYYR